MSHVLDCEKLRLCGNTHINKPISESQRMSVKKKPVFKVEVKVLLKFGNAKFHHQFRTIGYASWQKGLFINHLIQK